MIAAKDRNNLGVDWRRVAGKTSPSGRGVLAAADRQCFFRLNETATLPVASHLSNRCFLVFLSFSLLHD